MCVCVCVCVCVGMDLSDMHIYVFRQEENY